MHVRADGDGPTNVAALPGITADQGLGLYGLETAVDQLMTLNTMTGKATPVGPLGIDWGTGGLTWSDDLKDTYAINGTDDRLYTINHVTGKASFLVQTNYNFGSVGVEWHPKTHEIFACSNPAELLHVYAQGYHIGKPAAAEDIFRLFEEEDEVTKV